MMRETHSASRTIIASARAIFRALLDPEVVVKWRAPNGMTARFLMFDARPGAGYRMELSYGPAGGQGKSTPTSDIVHGRFVEFLPDEKIVETIQFESDDPAFAGIMTVTTTLAPVIDGTKVTIMAENVPTGISEADHQVGMNASLKKLADFLE